MSVSRGCLLVERTPSNWYCLVCHDEYEFSFQAGNHNVYGPAKTEEGAFEMMHRKEANPGSSNTVTYDELAADDKLKEFIDKRRR